MELFKGEYASIIVMPTKKDIFGNWINTTCVGITIWWINGHVQTNMPCPYQRRFFMPLDRLRFLVPWIWSWLPSVVIEGGWQGQNKILRNWFPWEGLFVPMEIFAIWFEKYMPVQNFKGSWIECWWVLVLPNPTLMTSLFLAWP